MSKKLACGADAIVLDIKVGRGAFMKTVAEAETLARLVIETGKRMNRKVVAMLTAMDQPLGYAVGNALEVKEAIDTLKGNGPDDFTQLCLELGSQMLLLASASKNRPSGKALLEELIQSGAAFAKFKTMVEAQGGDLSTVDQPELLPVAELIHPCKNPVGGYVQSLDARKVGLASMKLGAGRGTIESSIDFSSGVLLKKKVGDFVSTGEVLAELHTNEKSSLAEARTLIENAYEIGAQPPEKKSLIYKTIG